MLWFYNLYFTFPVGNVCEGGPYRFKISHLNLTMNITL